MACSRLLLAGGLSSAARRDRFRGEKRHQLWKKNKMLGEPQNDGYATSIKAHFFGKEFHNLKIIPQNRDFYAF